MSNLLVIKAHPLTAEKSQAVAILDTFTTTYQATHPNDQLTIVDLYHENLPEIDADILTAYEQLGQGVPFTQLAAIQQEKLGRLEHYLAQFSAADKLIIASPLWNLNIPTRLKAWFDAIVVAGKTFKYTPEGPVGLVQGKKAVHIQSNGGIYHGEDFAAQYVKGILHFIGITDFQALYIEGAAYAPEQAAEIMADAKAKATKLAENF